ncbi:MAG: UDP-N-acetylglucosamine 2-epimerase (non-hydrolyzing), partial [Anaerolineae bacterium]|nr:UDP-N-acetylglucosamine 2-epimerase (non-hydrolyzing) [Anaerolineae bacterium]
MKCITVVGTRPEFIQIAPLTRALRQQGHQEILVNTGQHYDDNMSQVFFRELDLPQPEISLG